MNFFDKLRAKIYDYKYGRLRTKPKNLLQIRRELEKLHQRKVLRLVTIDRTKDSSASMLLKAQDTTTFTIIGYTLNWVLGLVSEPPVEYLKVRIKARNKKNPQNEKIKAMLEGYYENSQIDKEYLSVLLGKKVGGIPEEKVKIKVIKKMIDEEKKPEGEAPVEGEAPEEGGEAEEGEKKPE